MKYFCLIDNASGSIAQLDDIRQDGNQKVTVSCSAIYATKLDATNMKKLLEKLLKKENLVSVKECNVELNEEA